MTNVFCLYFFQMLPKVIELLQTCRKKIDELYPVYASNLTNEFWQFSKSVVPAPGVQKITDLWTSKETVRTFGEPAGPYKKAVQLMHMMVKYFTSIIKPVVTRYICLCVSIVDSKFEGYSPHSRSTPLC